METKRFTDIGREVEGYAVNGVLPEESRQYIAALQQRFIDTFPDVIWNTPQDALHITLMAWLTPMVEYGRATGEVFEELFPAYDEVFKEAVDGMPPIHIQFDTLKATPDAIILIGHDTGEFQRIRQQFLERVDLLRGTKLPPNIIHTSIARYQKEHDLTPIIAAVEQEKVALNLAISAFHLVKETKLPMLEREVVEEYSLA